MKDILASLCADLFVNFIRHVRSSSFVILEPVLFQMCFVSLKYMELLHLIMIPTCPWRALRGLLPLLDIVAPFAKLLCSAWLVEDLGKIDRALSAYKTCLMNKMHIQFLQILRCSFSR